LVELLIVKAAVREYYEDFYIPSQAKSREPYLLKKDAWIMNVRMDDDLWEELKGKLRESGVEFEELPGPKPLVLAEALYTEIWLYVINQVILQILANLLFEVIKRKVFKGEEGTMRLVIKKKVGNRFKVIEINGSPKHVADALREIGVKDC